MGRLLLVMKTLVKKMSWQLMFKLALCICLMPSMLQLSMPVRAAAANSAIADAVHVADPDTTDTYVDMLISDQWGSRYAGRVWTDKSVFAYGDEESGNGRITLDNETDGYVGSVATASDFLHVYSTLGSSQVINEEMPLDVMFVIDISSSMSWFHHRQSSYSLIYLTVQALNASIDQLLEASPNSRFGIAVYSSKATVLLPLGQYEKLDDIDHYIDLQEAERSQYFTITVTAKKINNKDQSEEIVTKVVTNNNTNKKEESWKKILGNGTAEEPYIIDGGSTNIQAGLAAGLGALADEKNTLYTSEATGNLLSRVPVMILLSDGAVNTMSVIDTDHNWSKPSLTDDFAHSNNYKEGISVVDCVQGPESYAPLVDPYIISTLMTASYYTSAVNNHYQQEAEAHAVSNINSIKLHNYSIFTLSAGEQSPTRDRSTVNSVMNPAEYFINAETETGGEAYNLFREWCNKGTVERIYDTCYYDPFGESSDPSDPFTWAIRTKITLALSNDQLNNDAYGVKVSDVQNNIHYIPKGNAKEAEFTGIGDTFSEIISALTSTAFTPVDGPNDVGVEDALTYMDPIGQYMEVKNNAVKVIENGTEKTYDLAMLLFGEMHGMVRDAVYDYNFNQSYVEAHPELGTGGGPEERGNYFVEGWYKGGSGGSAEYFAGELPEGCTTHEEAWEKGYVYRVKYTTTQQYVSTLNKDSTLITDQQKNTVYTLYRFACEEQERNKLRLNPNYGDPAAETKLEDDDPGVYSLSEIRVWTEYTGSYHDDIGGSIAPDLDYEDALYINFPAAALPMQVVEINANLSGVESYRTNVDDKKESAPIRFFYSVGIQNRVMTEDGLSVDFTKISQTYLDSHMTDDGGVWFWSNYYSNTPYDGYVTDNATIYTRGNAVLTFSPGEDSQHYIFQKPLPLFAHAYMWDGQNFVVVDGTNAESVHNAGTQWIDGNTGGANWRGGKYRGMFASLEGAKQEVIDGTLQVEEGDIILLQDDAFKNVDDGDGGPQSITTADYVFLCIEFYVPTDNNGNGEQVKYVISRKGQEFGAINIDGINNGDMMCWVDLNRSVRLELNYNSVDITGDITCGRPTEEKLTYNESDLKTYLQNTCKVKDEYLDTQVEYWQKIQTQLKIELDVGNLSGYLNRFDWAVATKTGGLRTGALIHGIGAKGSNIVINEETGETMSYIQGNRSGTADNYYLPTVSRNSVMSTGAIIDIYLGNNGRMSVENTKLLVTKQLEPPEEMAGLAQDQKNREFTYQVYIQGITGDHNAVKVVYDQYAGLWRRRIAAIDAKTNNQELLEDSNHQLVVVDEYGRIAQKDEGGYFPTNSYYVYIGNNITNTSDEHVFRVYGAEDGPGGVERGGFTIYVANKDQIPAVGLKHAEYEIANEDHPAGSVRFWADEVYLIPVDEYQAEGDGWIYDEYKLTHDIKVVKKYVIATLTIDEDGGLGSHVTLTSPFAIESHYLSVSLYFGVGETEDDADCDFKAPASLYDDDAFTLQDGTTTDVNEISAHTAQFTLNQGEGLLFNGLESGLVYRVTEKLTDDDINKGYVLGRVRHVYEADNIIVYDESGKTDAETGNTAAFSVEKHTYSIFGQTSYERELAVQYTNTLSLAGLVISKALEAAGGTTLGDKDVAKMFDFALTLTSSTGDALIGPFSYTIFGSGEELAISGTLRTESKRPEGETVSAENENDIFRNEDGTWSFRLRTDQFINIGGLPESVGYGYSVIEAETVGYKPKSVIPDEPDPYIHSGIVVPGESSERVAFVNEKQAPSPVSISLSATKVMNVVEEQHYTLEADMFTYTITPANNNPEGDPLSGQIKTVTNLAPDNEDSDAGNSALIELFEDAVFTRTGIYTYFVREKPQWAPGISYDGRIYTVTVKVEEDYGAGDDGYTGRLKAIIAVNGAELESGENNSYNIGAFTNSYDPNEIMVMLSGIKILENGTLQDGQFAFELEGMSADTTDIPIPDGTTEGKMTATNNANGFSFDSIRFTSPGVYIYEVRELSGAEPGIRYDTRVYTVTVTVERIDDVLRASWTIVVDGQETDWIEFVNSMETGSLLVTKTVTGETGETNREFHFSVTLDPGLDGIYGDISFKNGIGEFTLKHGESKNAADLPVSVTYSVTELEANEDGYATGVIGGQGTISGNQTAYAEFTNNRDEAPPLPGQPTLPEESPPPGTAEPSVDTNPPEDAAPSTNQAVTSPPTGDESQWRMWWTIMGLSAVGIVWILFFSHKRSQRRK